MASDEPAEKTTAPADEKATTTEKTSGKTAEKEPRRSRRERGRDAGAKVKAGTDAVRNRIASVVWLIAVLCALILAVGALLIALKANQDNAIVSFVLDAADKLDLGVFSRQEGIFTFDGKNAATKDALVNWGIGAIAYLVVGKILDRVIRP